MNTSHVALGVARRLTVRQVSELSPDVTRLLARLEQLRSGGHGPAVRVEVRGRRRGRVDLLAHEEYASGFRAGVDAAIRAVTAEFARPASDDTGAEG
jgi:hypothetical protein